MSKTKTYQRLKVEIDAVVDGEPYDIARYASAACILSQAFEDYYWTGFYVVDPKKETELVVGPYQGTIGCLRIPFGRGVCGVAAATCETQLVDDVHAFPGHIACDSATNSEIVVPVFDDEGILRAVLDVDSTRPAAFGTDDQAGLEAICKTLLKGVTY